MRSIFFIIFFVFTNSLIGISQEKNDNIDYARTGDYFPYVPLTDEDSLYYPVVYEIELFVNDL
jgi:hypothetical protein